MNDKKVLVLTALIAALAMVGCDLTGSQGKSGASPFMDAEILFDKGISGAIQVAACSSHSLALKSNGDLYATGQNTNGQLGTGDTADLVEWKRVLRDVYAIAAGDGFSLAAKTDGSLWVTGSNYYGQLGMGDTTARKSWTRNALVSNVKKIAAGRFYSMFINSNGSLYASGRNQYGQLGTGNYLDRNSFIRVFFGVQAVACGTEHSVLIDSKSKRVYATGRNQNGQLGMGDTNNRASWTVSGSAAPYISIACGHSHTLAVNVIAELYVTGDNSYGQLGLGNFDSAYSWTRSMTSAKEAFAGGNVSFVKTTAVKAKVYGAGVGSAGQLGIGEDPDIYETNWTYTYGSADAIATDGNSSFLIDAFLDHLLVTGKNRHGELGLGDTERREIWTDGL